MISSNPDFYRFLGTVKLDSEVTTYHAQRVQKLHPAFIDAWQLFFKNTSRESSDPPADPDMIRKMGSGSIHLMGLIDLTLKLSDMNISVAWVYPESYMHPGWQVALADLAIWFSKRKHK